MLKLSHPVFRFYSGIEKEQGRESHSIIRKLKYSCQISHFKQMELGSLGVFESIPYNFFLLI